MSVEGRTIAVLAANPAFSSILGRVFQDAGAARVPVFSSLASLSVFLRITPVDAAILSLDLPWAEIADLVRGLRQASRAANPLIEFVALSDATPIGPHMGRGEFVALGKPASPGKVMAAVTEALAGDSRRSASPPSMLRGRRDTRRAQSVPVITERQGNVIPLFGPRISI